VAFIGQRSGEPLQLMAPYFSISRNIEGHNIEDNYTAVFQNLVKPSLKSSSTISKMTILMIFVFRK
jgi:hypothetical protein